MGPMAMRKHAWEVIALIVLGSFAVQYAVAIVVPLLPYILGTGVAILIGTIIYRRRRGW